MNGNWLIHVAFISISSRAESNRNCKEIQGKPSENMNRSRKESRLPGGIVTINRRFADNGQYWGVSSAVCTWISFKSSHIHKYLNKVFHIYYSVSDSQFVFAINGISISPRFEFVVWMCPCALLSKRKFEAKAHREKEKKNQRLYTWPLKQRTRYESCVWKRIVCYMLFRPQVSLHYTQYLHNTRKVKKCY